MKIVKNSEDKNINFGVLNNGDVFESNGLFYMVLGVPSTDINNAVRLYDGMLTHFDATVKVTEVGAELHIKRK